VDVGGLMDHAFGWVLENGGIDTENDYKYHAVQGQCSVNREHRIVVTIDDYNDGALLSSDTADRFHFPCILTALFSSQPCAASGHLQCKSLYSYDLRVILISIPG
jgi:hypothetical protein